MYMFLISTQEVMCLKGERDWIRIKINVDGPQGGQMVETQSLTAPVVGHFMASNM